MEQSTKFNLNLALNHYLNALNSNRIISRAEQDELYDHLYSETETLQKLGLTPEESFMISQKRFGKAELINSEFQKAKPWARVVQFLSTAIIFVFGIRLIFNLVSITSISTTIILSKFSTFDIPNYLKWGDLGLQAMSLIVSLMIAMILLKKTLEGKARNLWLIPITFLLSEIIRMFMLSFFASTIMTPSTFGRISLNSGYIYFGITLIGVIFSCLILARNRKLTVQFN